MSDFGLSGSSKQSKLDDRDNSRSLPTPTHLVHHDQEDWHEEKDGLCDDRHQARSGSGHWTHHVGVVPARSNLEPCAFLDDPSTPRQQQEDWRESRTTSGCFCSTSCRVRLPFRASGRV